MNTCFSQLLRCGKTVGVIVVVALIAACSKNEEPDAPQFSRSVLVYLSAQNSLAGNVSRDIEEMLSAASNMGENDRLVLFLDDNNYSRFYEIKKKQSEFCLS